MKPLSRLESLIADILERPAWALSSRKLRPLELTAALTKALEATAIRLADRVLAPDAYELRLNPTDASGLGDLQHVLEQELAEYLSRTIAERDISSNRQPIVRIVADTAVKPGKSRVVATFSTVPSPAPASGDRGVTLYAPSLGERRQAAPATAPSPRPTPRTKQAALEIRAPGGELVRRFELTGVAVSIGRGRAANLMLTDTRISREHARIERDATGAFTVSDLASLNGTLVNGELVRGSRRLQDGDLLEIGRFRLRFVAGATR